MTTKYTSSLLHGAACDCDIFGTGYGGGCIQSRTCRHGCSTEETVAHVLLDCPYYSKQRSRVSRACYRLNIPVSLKNLLCHPGLHLLTEAFFIDI